MQWGRGRSRTTASIWHLARGGTLIARCNRLLRLGKIVEADAKGPQDAAPLCRRCLATAQKIERFGKRVAST